MCTDMKKLRFLAAALAVLLLFAAGTASAEEDKDPSAWTRDYEIMVPALRFSDPYIGVAMPSGRGWISGEREAVRTDGFREAWRLAGSGMSGSVPVALEYTLYVRKDGGAKDPDAELADWLAQRGGESGHYYVNGRPGAYTLYAAEDGQSWEVAYRILYDRLIIDALFVWKDPEWPQDRYNFLNLAEYIAVDGWHADITVELPKPAIRSAGRVLPGQHVQCFAMNAYKEDVTEYVLWSAKGAEVDGHGLVTVSPDAKPGDEVTVTAVPKDGGEAAVRVITVAEDPFVTIPWKLISPGVATLLELPAPDTEDAWNSSPEVAALYDGNARARYYLYTYGTLDTTQISINYYVETWRELPKTRTEQVKQLKAWAAKKGGEPELFSMNGWPGAYIVTEEFEGGRYAGRSIHYRIIYDCMKTSSSKGVIDIEVLFSLTEEGVLPEVDRAFALSMISAVTACGETVTLSDGDPVPVILEAGESRTITAGEKIQYTADNGRTPDPAWGGIVWEAVDGDGKKVNGATVKNGLLDVGKGIRKVTEMTVRARYKYCADAAETKVTVLPLAQKVAILSDGTYLYLGGDHALTLSAAGDPEGSRIGSVEWSVDKPDIASLTVNPDGTATLRALAPGKVKVTATEETGKKGSAVFTAAEPVTAVEITAKGKAEPGKTVTLTAATTPEKPARKDIEWSVDAGEDVAVINAMGQLKIAKTAAPGTVITVTCTALGAPEPVAATLQITVE